MTTPSTDFGDSENSDDFFTTNRTPARIPITVLSEARFMAMHLAHPETIRAYLVKNGMADHDVDRFFKRYQINPKRLLEQYKRSRQVRVAGMFVFLIGAFGAFQFPDALVIDFGILGIGVVMMWKGRIPIGQHEGY